MNGAGKFLGGALVASAAWAIAWQLGPGFSQETCRNACGDGTVCEDGLCLVDEPEPEVETGGEQDDTSGKKKKKRRRRGRKRRRKGGGGGDNADYPEMEGDAVEELPPFKAVNDRHIPQWAKKPINLDKYPGSERLSDSVVNSHMGRLNGRFQKCITTAAQYSESDIGSGTLSFKLRIGPDGKVKGVSVKAPSNLKVFGIVPCARKTVYDHRFPKYDGPPMDIDFSFDVG